MESKGPRVFWAVAHMVPAFVRMGDIHLVGDDIREIWSEAGNHDSVWGPQVSDLSQI